MQEVDACLKEVIKAEAPSASITADHDTTLLFVSGLCAHLINVREFNPKIWSEKVLS